MWRQTGFCMYTKTLFDKGWNKGTGRRKRKTKSKENKLKKRRGKQEKKEG